VETAIATAQSIFSTLTLAIWGEVNAEEEGPLPNIIGYTEAQDYVDADTASAADVEKARDFYLDASHRKEAPVFVLFVVPADEMRNANAFSIRNGYCSVVPVPSGVLGTADGHTYAHEIGHGLSLGHTDDTGNLMFPARVVPPGTLSGDGITTAQYKLMRAFLQANPSLSQP
jgi:hypothetical protein